VPLLPVTPLGYRDPRWGAEYTRRWEQLVSAPGRIWGEMPVATIPGAHAGGIVMHLDPNTLLGQLALQTGEGRLERGYVALTLMGIDPRLQELYRQPRRQLRGYRHTYPAYVPRRYWRTYPGYTPLYPVYPGYTPLYQERVRMRGPLHPMEHFLYSTVQMPGYLTWQEPFLLADALGRDYAQRVWYL